MGPATSGQLRGVHKVTGIITQQKEHKLSQYADDTSVFLRATEENLKNSLEILG